MKGHVEPGKSGWRELKRTPTDSGVSCMLVVGEFDNARE